MPQLGAGVSEAKVGDILGLRGTGVPQHLEDCFWRVAAVTETGADMDGPYMDRDCTRRACRGCGGPVSHSMGSSACRRIAWQRRDLTPKVEAHA